MSKRISRIRRFFILKWLPVKWEIAYAIKGYLLKDKLQMQNTELLKSEKSIEEKMNNFYRTGREAEASYEKGRLDMLRSIVYAFVFLFICSPCYAVNQKVDANGNAWVSAIPRTGTDAALTSASINVSSSGQGALVAAVSSKTTKVYRLFLVAASAVTVKFQDGNTDLCPAMSLAANEGIVLDFDGEPWFTTSTNTAFNINLGGNVQVSGRVYYVTS